MLKIPTHIRALFFIDLLFTILAIILFVSSPDYIFIGLAMLALCVVFYMVALILISKQIQLNNKQKDDRIKRLEEEVETLKKNI